MKIAVSMTTLTFSELLKTISDTACAFVAEERPELQEEAAFEAQMDLVTFGLRLQMAITAAEEVKACKCALLPTESGVNAYTDSSECPVHGKVIDE